MVRALPYLLALLLGVGAALLAACGETTRGGIAASDAAGLKRQLEDVRERVADGRCEQLDDQLRDVDTRIDELPRSVDARLVRALRNGADRLQRRAVEDCNANSVPTETAPPVTETAPTETQTAPPETTTTPPETTTVPPETTTVPPPPEPPVPTVPPAEPPPPPVNPGGGTPPEIP